MNENTKISLQERIARAPKEPGCYLWKDDSLNILYIGKARNLKKRLQSYLKDRHESARTAFLMQQAVEVEWVSTTSEAEALLLESNLIKKHKPRYNVRLKDDKSYPWICVSIDEPYPRIFLTRNTRNRKARYFGPYTDVRAARNTIDLIHKIFPVRKKRQKLPLKRPARPCMNYHIKRCLAPCQGDVSEEEYAKIIEEVLLFLEGRRETLENRIRERMEHYSRREAFERAAIYRDMLHEIRRITQDQNVMATGRSNEDVLALALREEEAMMVLLEFRGGDLIARKSFPIELGGKETNRDVSEIYYAFIRDHYLGEPRLPQSIRFQERLRAAARRLLAESLSLRAGHSVSIQDRSSPRQHPILRLAARNAELLLSERLLSMQTRNRATALADLQAMLALPHKPSVIECYDISHLQGTETVASGVVFVDGAPKPSSYRRYRIRSVEGINDPASIREVVARRLQGLLNTDKRLPDLMVIDGGLTQLNAACEAALSLGLDELPIVSLAKKHEEVYVPGAGQPFRWDPNRAGLRLLRQLRDEAHRFAITYQRKRRQKEAMKDVLDGIPGMGEKRKRALRKAFPDRRLTELSAEELQGVDGIGPALARSIRQFLDKNSA